MPEKFSPVSYALVDYFEEDDHSESETFHEFTKLTRTNVSVISRRVEQIKADPGLMDMMSRSWKTYPGARTVPLPEFHRPSVSFADVVLRRRSVSTKGRDFHGGPITLEQLGGLITLAYGPTSRMRTPTGGEQHLRATASAGALYPTELYVAAFDVTGLEPGLYHVRTVEHTLELVRPGDLRAQFAGTSSYESLCASASAAIVMTSVLRRTLSKYQHRGYRFALYDAGALTQSLYLAGTAVGLETCAVGGIYDDEVAEFLGVSPVDEPPQLAFLVGPAGPDEPAGGPTGRTRPTATAGGTRADD